MGEPFHAMPTVEKPPERLLDSWKAIAAYLHRDVTTVQRWEKREDMPVHRHLHATRGSVYAVPEELDAWLASRTGASLRPEPEPGAEQAAGSQAGEAAIDPPVPVAETPSHLRRAWILALGAAVCLGAITAWFFVSHRSKLPVEPSVRSIAVLPLRNLSGEPAQEYLADGVTEALIGRLSTIHTLRVVSHTSVSRFKDPQLSVSEIARHLGVDAVVEGSVTKQGDRLRVTAQLIRATTDEHLWSETYDRQMRDALTLESELAQSIAEKVQVTITGAERQRLSSAAPVAPEVYELYLKGRFALDHGNKEDLDEGIRDFEEAVNRDARFAPAYLGLAVAYSQMGTIFAGMPPLETREKVVQFAEKALALDPGLAAAHVVLANTLQRQWHWADAEAEYRRALAIDPNNAGAQAGYAEWLSCQGRLDEALSWVERARATDPMEVSGSDVSWILYQAHRYQDAIRESRSALAVEPDNAGALMMLAFPLIANNQAAEAVPLLEKALALSHGSPAVVGVLIHAYARAGRRGNALRLLAELNGRRKKGYVPAGAFVNAYLGLDDTEQSFFWLEQAYREQSTILQFLKTHPHFDSIRGDPRFADLLRRVGLG
ncbi:MAG TPA: tetratricopeptide repeat protein [Acidobacteriaceae bacterium]